MADGLTWWQSSLVSCLRKNLWNPSAIVCRFILSRWIAMFLSNRQWWSAVRWFDSGVLLISYYNPTVESVNPFYNSYIQWLTRSEVQLTNKVFEYLFSYIWIFLTDVVFPVQTRVEVHSKIFSWICSWDWSRNTPQEYFFSSIALPITLVTRCTYLIDCRMFVAKSKLIFWHKKDCFPLW